MTAARRTNQPQRSGPTSSAHDLNFVTINDLSAREAITLFLKRSPFAVAIKALRRSSFSELESSMGESSRGICRSCEVLPWRTIGQAANRLSPTSRDLNAPNAPAQVLTLEGEIDFHVSP